MQLGQLLGNPNESYLLYYFDINNQSESVHLLDAYTYSICICTNTNASIFVLR